MSEIAASPPLQLSVVAPMFNEAEGAGALVREIADALQHVAHEIIIVDDASTDETNAALSALRSTTPQLRILRHDNNAGQSRALRTGIFAARAPLIATLDGDGQNDPADIPKLLELILADPDLAMVAGERLNRQDNASKKLASRLANGVRMRLLRDGAADTGCGLKIMRREAFLQLPYFDHLHRYLPAMMRREGFEVRFSPVAHRARRFGASKYTNFGRLAVAIRDIMGVLWLLDRSRNPGRITEDSRK